MLNREKRYRIMMKSLILILAAVLTLFSFSISSPVFAQDPATETAGPTAAPVDPTNDVEDAPPANSSRNTTTKTSKGINLLDLIAKGGWPFLTVLGMLLLMVITITIERFLALRRIRVLPSELIASMGKLGGAQGGFDPRQAYRLCQQFPSSVSTVIRAMLLKVGRPHSEVEHAVGEASEREADRLYSNVRWLNLAAAVAPLVGLLGTVWGLIVAFHDSTLLSPGQNMAVELGRGIYTALVTTLIGLVIAIPAAIFAHYFENRITSLFHQVDELLFNLLPQIERYEGRVRFNRQASEGEPSDDQATADNEPPVQSRAAVSPK